MWINCEAEVTDLKSFGSLKPKHTFIFYDGPKLFSFKDSAGALWLAHYLGRGSHGELFLLSQSDRGTLDQLSQSRIPIRQALLARTTLMVGEVKGQEVVRAMTILKHKVPESKLPKPCARLPVQLKNLKLAFKFSTSGLSMTMLSRVLGPFQRILDRQIQAGGDLKPPRLVPGATRRGSFEIDFSVENSSRLRAKDFIRAWSQLKAGPDSGSLDDWAELLSALEASGEKGQLSVQLDVPGEDPQALVIDRAEVEKLLAELRQISGSEGRVPLVSSDIPQANDIDKVIRLVALYNAGGKVSPANIGVTSDRQLQYYQDAAALLGLLEGVWPTPVGRIVVTMGEAQAYGFLAMLFESARVGQSWLRWSGATNLKGVHPESAGEFLRDVVQGLSPATIQRRASTLSRWAKKLLEHHYDGIEVEASDGVE